MDTSLLECDDKLVLETQVDQDELEEMDSDQEVATWPSEEILEDDYTSDSRLSSAVIHQSAEPETRPVVKLDVTTILNPISVPLPSSSPVSATRSLVSYSDPELSEVDPEPTVIRRKTKVRNVVILFTYVAAGCRRKLLINL